MALGPILECRVWVLVAFPVLHLFQLPANNAHSERQQVMTVTWSLPSMWQITTEF